MARIYYSGLVNIILGRLGDFVYSKVGKTPYVKYQPKASTNPNSPRQQQIKSNLSYLSHRWSTLSDIQQLLWLKYCSGSSSLHVAKANYVRLNAAILGASVAGLTTFDNPPAGASTPVFPKNFCAYNISGSCVYLSWTSPLATCYYVTGNYRLHYNFCRKFPDYGLCPSIGYRPTWRFIGSCVSSVGNIVFPHDYPHGAELFFRTFSLNLLGVKSPKTHAIPIVVDYNQDFYVVDQGNSRILKYSKIDRSFICKVGSPGCGPDEFYEPLGISRLGSFIFVSEKTGSRISKRLKSDLSYISVHDGTPPPENAFGLVSGVCADEHFLYFYSFSRWQLIKLNISDLSIHSYIGSQGTGDGQFEDAYSLCVDHTYIYVADSGNHRIQIFKKSDLSFVRVFGSEGKGDYMFIFPAGVAVDFNFLYVADTLNHRIVKYSKPDMIYISEYGSEGSGIDELLGPGLISVDFENIYIPDSMNNRIMIRRKSDFSYLSCFGSEGSGNYEFQFPICVALDDIYFQLYNQ